MIHQTDGIAKLITDLRVMVDSLVISDAVVSALLPQGIPHETEKQLWDYKEDVPLLPQRPSEEDRKAFNGAIGDIIKDVVSFHNAYGGYIIFGISDKGKSRINGVTGDFDCGDFNKRLKSYIGDSEVECHYARKVVPGSDKEVGVLLVPRRANGAAPVRFFKDGPSKSNGKSFGKDTYVRVRDECRPAASTATDWRFLFSDRDVPDSTVGRVIRPIPSTLPARDADLVEFVGRDDSLAKLRGWMNDPRSPTRLITGIGGLGKTTLAYRFAEEVTDLPNGEIEQVVWITAKAQTYSVLQGKLVSISRVDFADLKGLYEVILKTLRHEPPLEEYDLDLSELEERVIEALSFNPSLVIVDDIDSLQPEEQREVVASLQNIASRTVGRELPPTRMLMTSRIDQGLPQTSVLKLTGLEDDAFDRYVSNICKTFGINEVYGEALNRLREVSSGSPLFAASIVRLVKLGESISDAIESWSGQDGEEVRSFAFKREISRLTMSESKLLLAVMLLGETSIADLVSVLGIDSRTIRERISHLQAYHLLATSTDGSSTTKIAIPNDLATVAPILREHLGNQADSIDQSCARARQKGQGQAHDIGHGIRTIIDLWKSEQAPLAAIHARKLRDRYPDNADIACILGASLLKLTPPDARGADIELQAAFKMKCSRPELVSHVADAKAIIGDWDGLYEFMRPLSSNEAHRDVPLQARVKAAHELIKVARIRVDHRRVIELGIEMVDAIHRKTNRQALHPTFFLELVHAKNDFGRAYQTALAAHHSTEGDQLYVFEGMYRLAEADVLLSDLILSGLTSLKRWWQAVEARPITDQHAREILLRQIGRLDRLERLVTPLTNGVALKKEISQTSHDLAFKGASYARS